jgi:hypothetical protein
MRTAAEILIERAKCQSRLSELDLELAQALANAGSEATVKSPPKVTKAKKIVPAKHDYEIAPDHKGSLAVVILAMYRNGMIRKVDGTKATNVEDVARCIGNSLGESFLNWDRTLQGVFKKSLPWEVLLEMEQKVREADEERKERDKKPKQKKIVKL